MKPKFHRVLEQCIETGIRLGWNRAHKHNDTPDEETIVNEIMIGIEHEIYEWFDFEEIVNG